MKRLNVVDWLCLVLVIIGGINWGAVGLARTDLVALVLGDATAPARIVYTLVGLAAVYVIFLAFKLAKNPT